jgi:hypothetical protein
MLITEVMLTWMQDYSFEAPQFSNPSSSNWRAQVQPAGT